MQRACNTNPRPAQEPTFGGGVAGEELTLVGLEGQPSAIPTPAQRS